MKSVSNYYFLEIVFVIQMLIHAYVGHVYCMCIFEMRVWYVELSFCMSLFQKP